MKTVRMGESAREGGRRMSVSGDVSAPVDSTSRRQMWRWPLQAAAIGVKSIQMALQTKSKSDCRGFKLHFSIAHRGKLLI